MKRTFTRRNTAVGAIALAVGLVIGTAGGGFASQGGLPADKTAVAGSNIEDFTLNAERPILSTRMGVSTTGDLILGVTLECSILTRLVTNNDDSSADTMGAVEIRVTVEGKTVPVQTAGTPTPPPSENGRVTFCNRTYERSVTDQEDNTPPDGIDQEDDYIETKTANAFNWVAFNVGVDAPTGYDNLSNGNNVVDVVVHARYTSTHAPRTCLLAPTTVTACSEAYVGQRTLVIEPVHAAKNEQSSPLDPAVTL